MSEAPKLLPCPFCGSDPAEPWFDEDAEWGEVYCAKCSASTQGSHQGWMTDDDDRVKSILEAIAAWNTRDTTHAQAMVAAEREACAAIAEAEMKRNAAETYSGGTVTVHRSGQSAAKCYAAGAILEAIRARTPDDAQAALAALLKAERVKALKEAAEVAALAPYKRGGMICGCSEGLSNWTEKAILALIEKETGHE